MRYSSLNIYVSKLLQQFRLDTLARKVKERSNPKTPTVQLRKVVVPKPFKVTKAGR